MNTFLKVPYFIYLARARKNRVSLPLLRAKLHRYVRTSRFGNGDSDAENIVMRVFMRKMGRCVNVGREKEMGAVYNEKGAPTRCWLKKTLGGCTFCVDTGSNESAQAVLLMNDRCTSSSILVGAITVDLTVAVEARRRIDGPENKWTAIVALYNRY